MQIDWTVATWNRLQLNGHVIIIIIIINQSFLVPLTAVTSGQT